MVALVTDTPLEIFTTVPVKALEPIFMDWADKEGLHAAQNIINTQPWVYKLLRLKSVLTLSKVNTTSFPKMYSVNMLLKTPFSC